MNMKLAHSLFSFHSKVPNISPFIYHLSFIISSFLLSAAPATAQMLMRDVFAAMPDSVLPMVTKNNRLDCIDFIENNMEAKVRNILDEYVTLEALTPDYARFRTSASSLMELKLLPVNDSTMVLCLVTTAQTGEPDTPRRLEDSNIRFLKPDWSPRDSTSTLPFSLPPLSEFMEEVPAADPNISAALRSLQDFHPVRLALSPEAPILTATLQPAYLSIKEREAITPLLHPLTLHWNGFSFVKD